MFSKELEDLIQASLEDGKLDDIELRALSKRAQKEGVDIDELQVYINSIIQKRRQTKTAEEDAREAERLARKKKEVGKVCPHCNAPIPPLADKCPECGTWIMTAELNDKLERQLESIRTSLAEALGHSTDDDASRNRAIGYANKAKSELVQLYTVYSSVPKIQNIYSVLKTEIDDAIVTIQNRKTKEEKDKKEVIVFFVVTAIILIICLPVMILHEKGVL